MKFLNAILLMCKGINFIGKEIYLRSIGEVIIKQYNAFGAVIGLLKQIRNEFMDCLPERRRNFWEVKNCT